MITSSSGVKRTTFTPSVCNLEVTSWFNYVTLKLPKQDTKMISTDSLTLIRMITFGIAVVICAAYACAATLGIPPEALPHWAPITAGAVAAAVVFGVNLLANASATIAAFDESYRADRRTAAFAGFWGCHH
ncbi:hypothetical protein ABMC88_03165 [Sulfitobacter sp. HNIBRBA2951]|uniref:hypothetical protein n=1 Tax=Sulfitobacter aquimarinus TaxID=3158557 RepID=UPI0032DF38F5